MLAGVSGFGGNISTSFQNIGSNSGTSFILRPPPDIRAPQSGTRATTRSLPSIRLFIPEDLTVLAQICRDRSKLRRIRDG